MDLGCKRRPPAGSADVDGSARLILIPCESVGVCLCVCNRKRSIPSSVPYHCLFKFSLHFFTPSLFSKPSILFSLHSRHFIPAVTNQCCLFLIRGKLWGTPVLIFMLEAGVLCVRWGGGCSNYKYIYSSVSCLC